MPLRYLSRTKTSVPGRRENTAFGSDQRPQWIPTSISPDRVQEVGHTKIPTATEHTCNLWLAQAGCPPSACPAHPLCVGIWR